MKKEITLDKEIKLVKEILRRIYHVSVWGSPSLSEDLIHFQDMYCTVNGQNKSIEVSFYKRHRTANGIFTRLNNGLCLDFSRKSTTFRSLCKTVERTSHGFVGLIIDCSDITQLEQCIKEVKKSNYDIFLGNRTSIIKKNEQRTPTTQLPLPQGNGFRGKYAQENPSEESSEDELGFEFNPM